VHLDGLKDEHDRSVSRKACSSGAVSAVRRAKSEGFRVSINASCSTASTPIRIASFPRFRESRARIDAITISPGYAYERAPDQKHFLSRQKTKQAFREVFKRGKGRKWKLSNPRSSSISFRQPAYHCTPWGKPTRNVFGWQPPAISW